MASCSIVILPLTLTGAFANVRVASAVKVPEKVNVRSVVACGYAALAFVDRDETATMPTATKATAAACVTGCATVPHGGPGDAPCIAIYTRV